MAQAPTPVFFAIITTNRDRVLYGGMAPVFFAETKDEALRVAMWISRITNADVHDLHNDTVVLIANQHGA
jgi:hypothetical protein